MLSVYIYVCVCPLRLCVYSTCASGMACACRMSCLLERLLTLSAEACWPLLLSLDLTPPSRLSPPPFHRPHPLSLPPPNPCHAPAACPRPPLLPPPPKHTQSRALTFLTQTMRSYPADAESHSQAVCAAIFYLFKSAPDSITIRRELLSSTRFMLSGPYKGVCFLGVIPEVLQVCVCVWGGV